ncbi:MAG TPA: trypsin-like peptidase domain-containing protein [Gemmatimonadaceae bacterium]|nr:trypsin-like peptidase domain-containing protein [Gemmatimonadaceae bacterium]
MAASLAGPLATALGATAARCSAELAELADSLRPVTARVHTRGRGSFSGIGAGVVWSASGLVVTNAHVVPGARGRWPIVELADGRAFEARLVARDPRRDLALLALEESTGALQPARIGDARVLRVGQLVAAFGHPLGIHDALALGIVHGVRGDDDPWLRADLRLAPGNSGGPLATLDGAVVGINSMIVNGLGIAIPSHLVQDFVRGEVDFADERVGA